MPKVSSGMLAAERNAPTPNWNRMPAIMPKAMPLGMRRISQSKLPDSPITSKMSAATR